MHAFEHKLSVIYKGYIRLDNGYYIVKSESGYGVVHSKLGLVLPEIYANYEAYNTHYGQILRTMAEKTQGPILDINTGHIYNPFPKGICFFKAAGLVENINKPGEICTLSGKKIFSVPTDFTPNFSTKDYIAIYKGNISILYSYTGKVLATFKGKLKHINLDTKLDVMIASIYGERNEPTELLIYKGKFIGKEKYFHIHYETIMGEQTVYGDSTGTIATTRNGLKYQRRKYLDTATSKMVPAFKLLSSAPKLYETDNYAVVKNIYETTPKYHTYHKHSAMQVVGNNRLNIAIEAANTFELYTLN